MKLKSILSIVVFAAAFVSSAAVAGLFAVKTEIQTIEPIFVSAASPGSDARPTQCFGHRHNAETSAVAKINALLKQDDESGRAHHAKVQSLNVDDSTLFAADDSTFSDYAAVTTRYADQSGAMKDSGLPSDFQSTWRVHMRAWRDYADFLEAMKIPEMRAAVDEDAFALLNKQYDADIKRTYLEVLRVAGSYGVNIDKFLR
jgi:hypothetical protein